MKIRLFPIWMKTITHYTTIISTTIASVLFLDKKFKKISYPNPLYICHSKEIIDQYVYSIPVSPFHNSILALFPYQSPPIKSSVWAMKYMNDSKAYALFAQYISDEIVSLMTDRISNFSTFSSHHTYIWAIPSSSHARNERSWDQMHQLATYICTFPELQQTCTYIPNLFSIKQSTAQHTHSRKDRLKNHSLSLSPTARDFFKTRLSIPTTIFIIDDITTTGATFQQAKRCIESAYSEKQKAIHIQCIALCH